VTVEVEPVLETPKHWPPQAATGLPRLPKDCRNMFKPAARERGNGFSYTSRGLRPSRKLETTTLFFFNFKKPRMIQ
jgi:hypothetical protein